MNKSTQHIMQNVATIIKTLIIHSIIANYKDLSKSIISFLLVLQPFLLFKPCAFYRQTIEETCEKLTENTAFTQLKHNKTSGPLQKHFTITFSSRFNSVFFVYCIIKTSCVFFLSLYKNTMLTQNRQ